MLFGSGKKTKQGLLLKQAAADHAIKELEKLPLEDMRLGFGSGRTVEVFIDALNSLTGRIRRPVASSSRATSSALKKKNIFIEDTNSINGIDLYIDGADEIDANMRMIKGGGGALTGEKILAWQSQKFWCLADDLKRVQMLGNFPVAVEVVLKARSLVARELAKMGGRPEYRHGFVSDHGNPILDVYNLDLKDPLVMEECINNLPGVVCNGIFARTPASRLFCAYSDKDADAEVLVKDIGA